jgi:acetyl-CoA acetyltransferase
MQDAYLIGTSCTRFGKQPGASFKDLTREAYLAVLRDASMADGGPIGNAWFGNCGMGTWGQPNIRGQVCFTPLGREGLFPERVAMTNVEGGCATASGADFAVTVAAATTTNYAAGLYDWRAQVSKAGEVFTIGSGQLTVQPSFASATDGRSSAKKSLDQVVAYLADSNNLQAAEYEIAGRRLKRLSIPELLALKSHLSAEVQRETAATRAAAGLPDQRRVYTRFLAPY